MFDLLEEVKNHKCFDLHEEESKQKIIDFLKNYTNCFSRKNFYGHITAGGFIADEKGNILLNHHKGLDMWFQFGGHCDDNPNILEVAKREILEETGLTDLLQIGNLFDVSYCVNPGSVKKNEPKHYHFDINFLFLTRNHNFQISDESTEIKWVTIEEAKKLIDPKDISMLRMVDKYEIFLNNKITSNKT